MRFGLVHSPVVGPTTWGWVAEALTNLGHDVVVPNLTAAAASGEPTAFAQAAAEATRADDEDIVIVGHSGAGAVLPLISAKHAATPCRMVFVDAGLPPCDGTFNAGGDFLPALRDLAADDLLPLWSQWWGDGVMETLVPNPQRRRAIEAEFPRVPLSFYETPIDLPAEWCSSEGGYILLSDPYRGDALRADSLGWPVVELPGSHLDLVNNETAIADTLHDLCHRSAPASG